MIFCPTEYIGTGNDRESARKYLPVIAEELDLEVYCFWTGNRCVGEIHRPAAESYKKAIGHRLFIWDNYPVNDANPTLHLGQSLSATRTFAKLSTGTWPTLFVRRTKSTASRLSPRPTTPTIPGATIQPVHRPGDSAPRQDKPTAGCAQGTCRDVPGMLIEDTHRTNGNPVIDRFQKIIAQPNSRWLAAVYMDHVQDVAERLKSAFPDQFAAACQTVLDNLKTMREMYAASYPE